MSVKIAYALQDAKSEDLPMDFDALLARLEREGPPEDAEAARSEYDVALRLRDLMGRAMQAR